jgi:hypothetical protein
MVGMAVLVEVWVVVSLFIIVVALDMVLLVKAITEEYIAAEKECIMAPEVVEQIQLVATQHLVLQEMVERAFCLISLEQILIMAVEVVVVVIRLCGFHGTEMAV